MAYIGNTFFRLTADNHNILYLPIYFIYYYGRCSNGDTILLNSHRLSNALTTTNLQQQIKIASNEIPIVIIIMVPVKIKITLVVNTKKSL